MKAKVIESNTENERPYLYVLIAIWGSCKQELSRPGAKYMILSYDVVYKSKVYAEEKQYNRLLRKKYRSFKAKMLNIM